MTTQGLPVAGSLALAAVLGAGGATFAGLGALAAQLAQNPAATRAVGVTILVGFFALAAVGDLTGSPLVWLSPFGWARHVQAFAGERWWLLVPMLGLTAAATAGAHAVLARRDTGSGLLAPRLGPGTAAPGLRDPLTLAWRRHRGALLGWTAGLIALGALLGAAAPSLGSQLSSPAFAQLGTCAAGRTPEQMFFLLVLYALAQASAAFAIATTLRLRGDETTGLADPLLTTPVRRSRWAGAEIVMAATGTAVALAGLGLAAGLTSGLLLGDPGDRTFALLGTTLAFLPACLLLTGLTVALLCWLPRQAIPAAWTVLALVILVDLLGEFRLVPPPVLRISPSWPPSNRCGPPAQPSSRLSSRSCSCSPPR